MSKYSIYDKLREEYVHKNLTLNEAREEAIKIIEQERKGFLDDEEAMVKFDNTMRYVKNGGEEEIAKYIEASGYSLERSK